MTAPAPRRRGRPSAHGGKNKARSFTLTMTDAAHDAVDAGAAATGMSKSDYVESVLVASVITAAHRARMRCSHTWMHSTRPGVTVRCAYTVGHDGPHAWGAERDDRT